MASRDERILALVHDVKAALTAVQLDVQVAARKHRISRKLEALVIGNIGRAVDVMTKFLDEERAPMTYSANEGKHTTALTVFTGPYINLTFQDGPGDENGTTNEEIIQLLISRIQSLNMAFPQPGSVEYNDAAIMSLENALAMLLKRTQDRERRGVKGTNQP